MVKKALLGVFALLALTSVVAYGKTIPNMRNSSYAGTIPPFKNVTNTEKVAADKKYDPYPVPKRIFSKIDVVNYEGKKVILNAGKVDVLFSAYWCTHCQRTLVAWSKGLKGSNRYPDIIYIGYPNGISLLKAKQTENQENKELSLGIPNKNIFFILGNIAFKKYAQAGVPMLVFHKKSRLYTLVGEHSMSVWLKALKGV